MNENKLALMVIYNHRFDKNIELIEKLYSPSFSNIFHIIPFYDGNKENVIPVYESSYQFEGYISQAYTHLKKQNFTHFFIIADDLLLNPKINEHNLWEKIGINYDECAIPCNLRLLHDQHKFWDWTINAMKYTINVKGVEIEKILPNVKTANECLKKNGIIIKKFLGIHSYLKAIYGKK